MRLAVVATGEEEAVLEGWESVAIIFAISVGVITQPEVCPQRDASDLMSLT